MLYFSLPLNVGFFRLNMRLIILLLFPTLLFSQSQKIAIEKQLLLKKQFEARIDSAAKLMNAGQYTKADETFVALLGTMRSVPSDLTFFFGKNSYFLQKHKQSIDWLNKYIQLKGPTGKYTKEAVQLKQQAEADMSKKNKIDAEKAKQILSNDYEIDCGPSGNVLCPVCSGTTIIVTRTFLGSFYKNCKYCDEHGHLTCTQFNLLMKGKYNPK